MRIFVDQVAHSPRANSARAVGHVAACFARANPAKTLAALFELCNTQIRLELEYGASSIPSTSTASPMEGDTTLQWYCLLLAGAIAQAGQDILPYGDRMISLIKHMVAKCKSERGYSHVGRLISWLLASLLSVWAREGRFVNASELQKDGESLFIIFTHSRLELFS